MNPLEIVISIRYLHKVFLDDFLVTNAKAVCTSKTTRLWSLKFIAIILNADVFFGITSRLFIKDLFDKFSDGLGELNITFWLNCGPIVIGMQFRFCVCPAWASLIYRKINN